MDYSEIIETINYAIKDINNGMEESGIKELEELVTKLKEKENAWWCCFDWKNE